MKPAGPESIEGLLQFEIELQAQGVRLIAGVDEAGVGPLAGPIVAAAVILPVGASLPALDDSKKLTTAKREKLADWIRNAAPAWGVGIAPVEEIDRINVYQAGLQAMRRAVLALAVAPEYLLVDARTIPDCAIPQRGIIRGDALSASIAAASIIAKTTRDAIMLDLDRQYPDYGFAVHKGYATAAHFAALQRYGALPIHRRSFRPVREALGLESPAPVQATLFA